MGTWSQGTGTNAYTPTPAIAVNKELFFVSDPGVFCFDETMAELVAALQVG